MEDSGYRSMHIAPSQCHNANLHEQLTSYSSSRPLSKRSYTAPSFQQRAGQDQLTPPITPCESESGYGGHEDFHTYLRAFFPYNPTFETDSTTVTLPLSSGDVILVHSIHTNGWADGTLLASGARGWLPTNYCEGYDNDAMSSLLKALTVFWDLVKGSSEGNVNVFRNPDYARGLVAGVRCLLERTNCLSRDCVAISSSTSVRKHRKALLSELSGFVKITKSLQSILNGSPEAQSPSIKLEDLVLRAFKTVLRAVAFLDTWEEFMQTLCVVPSPFTEIPPTPPADRTEFPPIVPATSAMAKDRGLMRENSGDGVNTARSHSRASTSQTHVPPSQPQAMTDHKHNRQSQSCARPGSANAPRQSLQTHSHRTSSRVSHRASYAAQPVSQNLASERLGSLHNTFLSYLGCFIGLHIQSRSSYELLHTTKQACFACRDLLDLVNEVWERDGRRSHVLAAVRDEMYRRIAELAEAARDAFRPLRSTGDDDGVMPCEGKPFMAAATACVRTAGECVAESRFVIDRIGDFDFPALGLGIAESAAPLQSPTSTTYLTTKEDQSHYGDSLESPRHFETPLSSPLRATYHNQNPPTTAIKTLRSSSPAPKPNERLTLDTTITATDVRLPPIPSFAPSPLLSDETFSSPEFSSGNIADGSAADGWRLRTGSLGVSSADDSSGYIGSKRESEQSALSPSSTRATSPDSGFPTINRNQSFSSSLIDGARYDAETEDIEASLLERTFAHELVHNKDGQITGGTLPALIERLSTPDATPDATFVSTFFLTFRLFVTPVEFAQALIDRYNWVNDSPRISAAVRLRVYNVFKGWLESHWRNDCDKSALDIISTFATRQLQIVLPTAGKRLAGLAEQVTTVNGPIVPRLLSSVGKTNTSIAQYISPDTPLPSVAISKSQMNALKVWKSGGVGVSILDFEPLEFARQLTLKESQIFCSILPEELLASEWTKQSGSMAVNVRAMSRLSTDLANLVADNILQAEDPKKRAIVIKRWTKIADKLLELSNYHSLMAIVCSLTQSTITRLKRTWECVSVKTKQRLEKFEMIIDHHKNYASLRQIFQTQAPPCVPWVGLYLTDLTFVDAGNPNKRQLSGCAPDGKCRSVINFDKHMKTAKIISELQRFQVPYRLNESPELQTWIQDQLVRVRTSDQTTVIKDFYRRSLMLEPRLSPEAATSSGREKFEKFLGGKSGLVSPQVGTV